MAKSVIGMINGMKFFIFCLIFQLFFLSGIAFCNQDEKVFPALEKQAQEYYQKGRQQVESGDFDSALTNFQKVIILTPNFVPAYNEAGVVLSLNGKNELAKEMYLRSMQIAPNYPQTYSNLASLYEKDGDFLNAALCWKKRVNLGGGQQDQWTEIARRRLQDIAKEYPEIYNFVCKNNQTLPCQFSASLRDEQRGNSQARIAFSRPVGSGAESFLEFQEPKKVDLFKVDETKKSENPDSKLLALNYLARAQDFYSNGDYVGALREATMAEYLDPANRYINAFVGKIRQAILK